MSKQFTFTIEDLVGGWVAAQYRYGTARGILGKPGGTSEFFCISEDDHTDPAYADFQFTEEDIENIEIEEGLPTIVLV
jgi:hypothetical protein